MFGGCFVLSAQTLGSLGGETWRGRGALNPKDVKVCPFESCGEKRAGCDAGGRRFLKTCVRREGKKLVFQMVGESYVGQLEDNVINESGTKSTKGTTQILPRSAKKSHKLDSKRHPNKPSVEKEVIVVQSRTQSDFTV